MNRGMHTALAAGLLVAVIGRAQSPTLRHVNYLALLAPAGQASELTAVCRSRGPTYQDVLRARLIEPDGRVVAASQAGPGERLGVRVPAGPERRLALELNSGWNAAEAHPSEDLPWALVAREGQPLQTVREWGPLFFFVPPGTGAVTLWVGASVTGEAAHLRVSAPDGAVALEREADFDQRTRLEIAVVEGQSGRPWSVALVPCGTQGWHTDDVMLELGPQVPGLLSPRAEWAARFAAGWQAPVAAKLSAKPRGQAPTRAPYRPPAADVLAQAYERRAGAEWRTSLPLTYVLDYGAAHLGNAGYVPAVASAPPTLLHLGKDVPFNHGWGPVRALGGENQAFGSGDAITRLTPDEVEARLAALREMVSALHASGVRYVTPYICAMTLNGDPVKRSGFWEFYEHWDEYRRLGLCPRPAQDPREWLQTTADGKTRLYYTYDQAAGFYPPFKTNHRYAACWRTEGWRTWLLEVVRFVARSGCDGVFVDNGCSQKSWSPGALAAYRAFLKQRYTAAQARELLGIEDLDSAAFPSDREPGLAAAELHRFWCSTLRDEMGAIKAAGSAVLGREFLVFPNGGHPAELQEGLRDTDYVMFEKSIGEYGTNPGLVYHPVLDGVTLRVVNDNLFELLFVRSLRERVRPIILTRAGYPQTRPQWVMNADAARLGMAECAAFSGGGGFLVSPRFDLYHDALNDMREFIETHPDLYAGLLPWTDTAVLALAEQGWLGNRTHLGLVQRLTPALADAHVRFELIPERRLDAQPWAEARVVAACQTTVLAERHVQALARYVAGGGTLLVAGPFAEKDEWLRPRVALPAPLDALPGLADGQTIAAGRGRLLRSDREEAMAAALGQAGMVIRRDDGRATDGVRLATYRSADGQRLILHLVNYHVPLGVEPAPVETVPDLTLAVPLPEGRALDGFRVLSPDRPPPPATEVTVSAGVATVRLPQLRVYAVVELRVK